EIAAENAIAEQFLAVAAIDFFLKDLARLFVFVADVKNAAAGAGDESGDDHALDHEPGHGLHDETIFDGAGFRLVRVANDVMLLAGRVANDFPFHPSRKTGPTHAAKSAALESGDDAGVVPGCDELADDGVLRRSFVRVGRDANVEVFARFRWKRPAGENVADHVDRLRGRKS